MRHADMALEFKEFSALNLADLAREMACGSYVEGAPHQFRHGLMLSRLAGTSLPTSPIDAGRADVEHRSGRSRGNSIN
ncbi:hypothetical protein [Bradyrhizobium sp. USDA 3364]